MDGLILGFDWASTSLGPIQTWAPALKTATSIMLASPVAMALIWGPEGILLYNDAYAPFADKRHPDILGKPVAEAWPEVADFNLDIYGRVLRGETVSLRDQSMTLLRSGEPEQVNFDLDYSPVRDETGTPVGELALVTETTARVRMEAAARAREARLQFFHSLADAVGDLATADLVLAVTTRRAAEYLGATVCAYADVDEDENGFAILGEWVAPGAQHTVGRYKLTDFGQRAVHELSAGRPLIINDHRAELPPEEAAAFQALGVTATVCMPLVREGRLTALMAVHDSQARIWTPDEIGVIRDIVSRSWAHIQRVGVEAALRESERRYRALFESMDEGFCVLEFLDGPDGPWSDYIHIEANPAHIANTGLPDIVGRRVRELVGDEADGWIDILRPVVETGEPIRFEKELEATGRWLELSAFRVEPAQRRQVAVIFKDLTARKRAEAELAASEAQFRAFAQAVPNHIWASRPDGWLYWFNEQVYAYLGQPGGNLQGADGWSSVVHLDDLSEASAAWARSLKTGEPYHVEFRIRRHDGAWRWFAVRAEPVRDEAGQITQWVGANIDIDEIKAQREVLERLNATLEHRVEEELTQRLEVEDALRQAQKLETIGQLTGGVAHDFNNLLTPIVGALDMLHRRAEDERTLRITDGALQAAERARVLVQRLLAFSRRQHLEPRPIDVGELVEGMADLIRRSLGPEVSLGVKTRQDLPAAMVDPNQLELAVLNLAVNGRDAMPEGGALTLRVREDDDPPDVLPPGRYVHLSVSDTGQGMDAETLARAIEPFFTTKGVGKGTGLGLSSVQGLAAQSGGAFTLDSAPGRGTTADLWLPAADVPAQSLVSPPAPDFDPAIAAGRVVLLVDDEDLVRRGAAEMLREAGYQVHQAASPARALQMIDDGLSFDVLVTDYAMPSMNGAELIGRVRTRRAEAPALLITGYASMSESPTPDGLARLSKPFRQADLASAVAKLLV